MEYPVAGGLLNSDLYVGGDFDLIIEIQGPTHYLNDGLLKNHIDSSLYTERIYRKHHKHYLGIPYTFFNSFVMDGSSEDLEKGAAFLRPLIEESIGRKF